MSWTIPDECSWYVTCQTMPCKTDSYDICRTIKVSDGPDGNSHNINTDYSVTVSGVKIPIVKTTRTFSVSYGITYGDPGAPKGYIRNEPDWVPLICAETPSDSPTCRVLENCVIEKSTLHYIDQRYGVCLYRLQRDEIHMDITSAEMAEIKVSTGIALVHQVQIKTDLYTATSIEEWHLVIDGVDKVICTTTKQLEPFGARNNGLSRREMGQTDGLFLDYHPDPETRLVLLFPQPPSLGLPWSDAIYRLGFYDYGNESGEESELNKLDGGGKDMFYPAWCRSLQTDPFWRGAADNRYGIDWYHNSLTNDDGYSPGNLSVDPIPLGSFVSHPTVGYVYQFLVPTFDGSTHLETSPNFNKLLDSKLPAGSKTHDTTLYYPIGVV
jgi:hypothetical protein